MLGFSPCAYLFSDVAISQRPKPESGWAFCGTTEQVAEKGRLLGKRPELQPSGAKAQPLVLFGLRHD